MINVICCQCGKKYGQKDDGKSKVTESHGYCDECYDLAVEGLNNFFKENEDDN